MTWDPGQSLRQGQYFIESTLGKGGFGITYLARKKSTNEKVVIKTLIDDLLYGSEYNNEEKEKFKTRFHDEAERLSLCKQQHPNIVQIETVFYHQDSIPCMVMEYIDGENLKDRVDKKGTLSEEEALLYVRQIGNALTFIHELGIIHRDVSPDNIIVRANSKDANSKDAILIDFGLARQYISSKTLTAHNKDGFSPVEQCYPNKSQGPYTDIYALAATLYYLLVGERLSPAWVRSEFDDLVPAKDKNPNISDHVNEAILKGLEIEATDRPASVQEWLEMLDYDQIEEESGLKQFSFDVVFLDVRGQQKSREQHYAELFEQVLNEEPFLRLEMVKIPSGTFLMGSPDFEMVKNKRQENKSTERPQHQVGVDSFFMSKCPITQVIWRSIANLPEVRIPLNPNCSYFKGDENPVEQVSWYQAIEFCDRLSQLTKLKYRLPSEAEWEYACRAGVDNKPFHFGDTITTKFANYDGTESYSYEPMGNRLEQTKPVGSFGVANAFGLYDMHGNVWEWCTDPKHDNYKKAPLDSRTWDLEGETNNKISRVLRGGSWKAKAKDCRAANRRFLRPTSSDSSYGFRVAISN